MLAKDLINNNIPRLQLQDTVGKALQLLDDYRITHLPVISDGKFLGLISEEDLLDLEDKRVPMELLQEFFIAASVPSNVHFLNAVSISIQHDTNIIAVVQGDEYLGVITNYDLLTTLGNFSGANEIGGIIELKMPANQFHLSEISRIVESNDCTILHLNTTIDANTGMLTVTLHINKREIYSLLATFQRYEYEVTYSYGVGDYEDELSDNYNHLMHYIRI